MFIEFTARNFRSIGEEITISAQPLASQKDFPNNILNQKKVAALNILAIYGANSSGKSNILKAMALMDKFISNSTKSNSNDKLDYQPFLLKDGLDSQETMLQLVFSLDGIIYRYGFEYNHTSFVKEWLFTQKGKKEKKVFTRIYQEITLNPEFGIDKTIIDKTRENVLFLSVCDQWNEKFVKPIFIWFSSFLYNLEIEAEPFNTFRLIENEKYRSMIFDIFKSVDLYISGFETEKQKFDPSHLPAEMDPISRNYLEEKLENSFKLIVNTKHTFYDKNNKITDKTVSLALMKHESLGTQKFFGLIGPIIYILENGGIFFIDELESQLHPLLCLFLIEMFTDSTLNPKNAQLIFCTHNTTILDYGKLRRDQIYFTEKNNWESTIIYSLADFKNKEGKKIRSDVKYEKNYLQGKFGAIPYLGRYRGESSQTNNSEK